MPAEDMRPVVDAINEDNEENGDEEGGHHGHGLSVFMASVFLVGEMAGSGVLALPQAVEATGWIGLAMIAFFAFGCSYTGEVLAECWTIVQDRFPTMRGRVRYPYPAIGMLTFGKVGRVIVSVAIDFTMLGGAVVFVLLASDNLQSVVKQNGGHQFFFCYWVFIVVGALWPFTLLGTPKDFKFVGWGAMSATSIACLILVILMGMDSKSDQPVIHNKLQPLSFASAMGTILYALGGHPMFPTFQNDMREPTKFGVSCRIAYSIMTVMYACVAGGGYFVYGGKVESNILNTVSKGPTLQVVQCLITGHLFCSFIIVINPICQEIEEILNIDKKFNYKRVLVRTAICVFVTLIAETVPHFGAILSLVGGSSTTLMAFICPPIFYFKLALMEGPWDKIYIPLWKKLLLGEFMIIGIVGGVISSYSAIRDLASPSALSLPCFVNLNATAG